MGELRKEYAKLKIERKRDKKKDESTSTFFTRNSRFDNWKRTKDFNNFKRSESKPGWWRTESKKIQIRQRSQ